MKIKIMSVIKVTFIVSFFLGCNLHSYKEVDEIIDFSELKYKNHELVLPVNELKDIFLGQPRIDSLESFKNPGKKHFFYSYSLGESNISFEIDEATSVAVINDAVFVDKNLVMTYLDISFSRSTTLADFRNIFPDLMKEYVDNGEGKYVDYEGGVEVSFAYKIPVRSNRSERDYFVFEFNEAGNLMSFTYNP